MATSMKTLYVKVTHPFWRAHKWVIRKWRLRRLRRFLNRLWAAETPEEAQRIAERGR